MLNTWLKAATEILTEYVYVVARIALMDKRMFLQLMSATGPTINMTEAQVWEAVLNQWWTRVGYIQFQKWARRLTPCSSTICRSRVTASLPRWAWRAWSLRANTRF